jgi:hypothetical protein
LERYLRGGSFDFSTEDLRGAIAASGIEHLPKPNAPGLKIEGYFEFQGPWEHVYSGRIDFVLEPPHTVPGIIGDHKTSRDFKYKKSAPELLTDEQSVIYSSWYFSQHPDEPEVENLWIYYHTGKTRKSAVTRFKVNQEHAFNELAKLESVAEEMAAMHKHLTLAVDGPLEKRPLTIPLTKRMLDCCSEYGGCGFQGLCNIGPMERLGHHLAKEKNKTMSSLLAKKPAAAFQAINPPESALPPRVTDAPAPVASPAAVAQPAQPPVGGSALLARVRAGVAGQALPSAGTAAVEAAMAAVAPMVAPTPEPGQLTQLGMETLAKYGVAVSSVSDTTEEMCARVNRGEPPTPFHAPAEVVQQAHAQLRAYTNENVPAEAPKGRKGRPVGSKNKPKVAPEVVPPAIVADVVAPGVIPTPPALVATGASVGNTVEVEMVTPPVEATAPKKNLLARKPEVTSAESRTLPGVPEPPAPAVMANIAMPLPDILRSAPSKAGDRLIGMLFVDCSPSVEFTDGNEIIAVAKEHLAADGIADYRDIDFGKGNAMLAKEVAAVLNSMTTLPYVRLDTRLQEYGAVAHEFIVRAKVVVR